MRDSCPHDRRRGKDHSRARGLPVEPRNLNRSFVRICNAAGQRVIRVHGLRHTTATLLKALKVDAKGAQVILGQAHVSMTRHYAHVDEDDKRDALSRLNKLLGGDGD